MNIQDYEVYLKNKEYQKVFTSLVGEIRELLEKIAKEKGIEVHLEENIDDIYKLEFQYKYSLFYQAENVLEECLDWDSKKNKEKLFYELVARYNTLKDNFNKYLCKKKEIKDQDVNSLFLKWVNKFQELFKEMADFKKIKEKHLIVYYPYYEEDITNIKEILDEKEIKDDLEEIQTSLNKNSAELFLILEELFNKLKDYKKHAYDYDDIILDENENYYDAIDKAILKYDLLFKEMLDYLNVSYQDRDIRSLVYEYYPFYKEHLRSFLNRADSYYTTLKAILDWYNFYQKDYKIDYNKKLESFKKMQEVISDYDEF